MHLVGENGPELLSFRGGERVWTAAQTQTYIRGTRPSGSGRQTISVSAAPVQMPDTITVRDLHGFEMKMAVIADNRIAADAHTDSVLLQA